jgi:hypothetical protein
MTAHVHVSKYGTYHSVPNEIPAWTINDNRGYLDSGPSCDECGACECGPCETHGVNPGCSCGYCVDAEDSGCIGLSFAFICLDGGDALCERCAEKERIEIVPCDCEE